MADISPEARCESSSVGAGTTIGPFAVIPRDCTIGANCVIREHVTIGQGVTVGDGVTIGSGGRVGSGATIGSSSSIGPNAILADATEGVSGVVLAEGAVVGAGSFVASGVRLELNCEVRPGSVVDSTVPPNAIVEGNPALIVAYSDSPTRAMRLISAAAALRSSGQRTTPIDVDGAALWALRHVRDLRGSLVPIELASDLPFVPLRQFFVLGVPGDKVRGEHAHRLCDQFLIAAHGALSVVIDNGSTACEVRLDDPAAGLYVPAGLWLVQYKFTRDAVLAVFASRPYESDDYIRDYPTFLSFRAAAG